MWNFKSSNEIINELNRLRNHREHLERLFLSKTVLNTSTPYTPKFLINNASNIQNERHRLMKISYENKILYNNMCFISSHQSPYSKRVSTPKYCPAFDYRRYDWVSRQKSQELLKENKILKKRYEDSKPHYPRKEFINSNLNNLYLIKNLKRNSGTFNPNLNFCTFRKFKSNLAKQIKRLNSASTSANSRGYREDVYSDVTNQDEENEQKKTMKLKRINFHCRSKSTDCLQKKEELG